MKQSGEDVENLMMIVATTNTGGYLKSMFYNVRLEFKSPVVNEIISYKWRVFTYVFMYYSHAFAALLAY